MQAYRVVGAYQFGDCYASTSQRVAVVESTIDIPNPTLAECFDQCPFGDGTLSLFVYLPSGSTSYECKCTRGRTPNANTQSICGSDATGFFYTRAAVPRTSPGNHLKRRAKPKQGTERFCPKGLLPCLISPDAGQEDYEVSQDVSA